jgi:hypothetical protein
MNTVRVPNILAEVLAGQFERGIFERGGRRVETPIVRGRLAAT